MLIWVMDMMDANRNTCSFFTLHKKPDSYIPVKAMSHTCSRICLVLDGSATWQINKKFHSVQAGDMLFFSEREKRRIVGYGDQGVSLFVIQLGRRAFMNPEHYAFFQSCILKRNGVFSNLTLSMILREIHVETSEEHHCSYDLVSAKLTEFFVKAQRFFMFEAQEESCFEEGILETLEYIDARITDGITLKEAAQHAALSESSFSRRFAKMNGIPFKKYVMLKRIEHAIFLLKTTDQKVVEIAYACGFDSISGFYSTFKSVTGTTPSKISYII